MTIRLAVETSTLSQSLALSVGGQVVARHARVQRGGHSRSLAATATSMLAGAGLGLGELDAFVVDIGPGSFTGLRVGLALVKGLAAVTGTPVLPVRSVDAIAAEHAPGRVAAVAFDAHNALVYGAVVDASEVLVPLAAWDPAAFAAQVAAIDETPVRLGGGWLRYADAMGFDAAGAPPEAPSADGLLLAAERLSIGPQTASLVEPLYVRKSAAEERARPPG